MFSRLQKLARKVQTASMAGRPVLAASDIVRRGHYVPRGSTGTIVRVRADGDFDIAFDRIGAGPVQARRAEVAPAPRLAQGSSFALRIFSH